MTVTMTDVSFAYEVQKAISDESQKPGKKGTVLSHVNLELNECQPVVLLGESGGGKTTLLRLLAGFLRPQSGRIDGVNADTRIAVLFQEDRLFPHMTVYKNLKLVCPGLTREEAACCLAELNLDENVLNDLPGKLSGGMRRRAALARALLFPAELVLLDEPFQGLDEDTHKKAIDAVKKRTEGRPLLLISHDPQDGTALGARVLRLSDLTCYSPTHAVK